MTVHGRVYMASLLIDVSLASAKSGRAYQASMLLPNIGPPLRGRVYQAGLVMPAPGSGVKGRVYMAGMKIPAPDGLTPPSGLWAARAGNVRPCGLRAAANGVL